METWTYNKDKTEGRVRGRVPVSVWKKINPVWWFGNDAEQTVDEAPWYQPSSPEWARQLMWALRNPLQNFRAYVIGVQDRNYKVTGRAPVSTVQRDDIGKTGWQWCVIWTFIPLPFVSYSGRDVVWYVGWQPSGFAGVKINRWAWMYVGGVVGVYFALRYLVG